MSLRLRQVALVARDLDRAVAELTHVFALGAPFNDPGVGVFGLHNAVFALGDTFLEVVSPLREDASAARFLARKGGDAGYMVIVQSDDLSRERKRLQEIGVRIVFETALDDIATLHIHPRDLGGAIVSIDDARPAQSWRWGGPGWELRGSRRVSGIRAAEIAAVDPEAVALQWSRALGRATPLREGEAFVISLEDGTLRFTACATAQAEGLVRVDLRASDAERIQEAARERGLDVSAGEVSVCGTRFRIRR